VTKVMEAAKPGLAGIYCRLSYAPDGSLEKVERQETDCRELAAQLRWPISDRHIYVDNSRSAWQRGRKRPAWDRMLADLEAGTITSIIVYHGDRLMRQPYDLERLIGVADRGGVHIASVSGTRDLDNPDDRFILRIEVAAACRESDSTSRRIHRKIKANAEAGKSQNGGRRPFGYGVKIGTKERLDPHTGKMITVPVWDRTKQVPSEARYLAAAAERLLAGQSQMSVVRWFRAEGVLTTEGNPFTVRNLQHLLESPRVAGLVEYKGQLYDAEWDGIISRETWDDLAALRRQTSADHGFHGRERKHLLTGWARCYACGLPVTTKPSGGRNRKNVRLYCCREPGCRAVGRNQAHLDAYVEGRTVRLLQSKELLEQLTVAEDQPDVVGEIARLEARRDQTQAQLDALADDPDIDVTAALRGMAGIERRLKDLREQLTVTAEQKHLLRMVGISRAAWEAEPVDVRATTIRMLWDIVILPATHRGPGFSPSSVEVTRRPLGGSTNGARANTGTERGAKAA
jgi:site-specific DNA recombinase